MNADSIKELSDIARSLRRWMWEASWPLWSGQGRHTSARFFEALEFDGRPRLSAKSRVRTQARQVFSFALASELGWKDGEDIVALGLPQLLDAGLNDAGVAGRLIDIESGVMLDDTADLYDTAFCLLAIAQGRAIVGADLADRMADALLASIDTALSYGDGNGYRETLPAADDRLQNPHMHFFESLLLYYDKSRRQEVRDRAEDVYRYVASTFFDPDVAVVRESVGPQETSSGYDPGHSMEWVWLLGYRARLDGYELPDFAYELYGRACAAYREHGTTCLYLDDENQLVDGSARLWSQTETLKAHLCIAELGDRAAAEVAVSSATQCARNIVDTWLQSEARGGWLDHFDTDRRLLAESMPASTGYHLYLAIAELLRVADVLGRRLG